MRFWTTTLTVLAIVSFAGVSMSAEELVYSDSFEEGMGGWQTYNTQPPRAELSVVAGDAADGQHFLRAEIPSGPTLAGPCVGGEEPRGRDGAGRWALVHYRCDALPPDQPAGAGLRSGECVCRR